MSTGELITVAHGGRVITAHFENGPLNGEILALNSRVPIYAHSLGDRMSPTWKYEYRCTYYNIEHQFAQYTVHGVSLE